MPNTREKLIELLQNFADGTYYSNGTIVDGTKVDDVADHLIANGVTVQDSKVVEIDQFKQWIPVTERLPEESDEYIAYCGDGFIAILPYSVQYKLFNTFDGNGTKHAMAATHWMPLPEPPKGEE